MKLRVSEVIFLLIAATSFVGLAVSSDVAGLKSNEELSNALERGLMTGYQYDLDCRNILNSPLYRNMSFGNYPGGPANENLRDAIDNGGAHFDINGWVSMQGRGNTTTPIVVDEGTTTLKMQINFLYFMCANTAMPDRTNDCNLGPGPTVDLYSRTGQYYYNETSRWATPTNGRDAPPIPILSSKSRRCAVSHHMGTWMQFRDIDVERRVPGGSWEELTKIPIGNKTGSALRDNNSRYWLMNPIEFDFTKSDGFTESAEYRFTLNYRNARIIHRVTGNFDPATGLGMNYWNNDKVRESPAYYGPSSIPWNNIKYDKNPYNLAIYVSPKPRVHPVTAIPSLMFDGETVQATHSVSNPDSASVTVEVERGLFHDEDEDGRLDPGEARYNVDTSPRSSSSSSIGFPDTSRPIQLSDFPENGRVCSFTRIVSVSESAQISDDSAHPNPAVDCGNIGRHPQTQISGGDVITSSGQVNTLAGNIQGRHYGSWMEFSVFAPGTVNSVTAAALPASNFGGSYGSNRAALTFANTTSPPGSFASAPLSFAGEMGRHNGVWQNWSVNPNNLPQNLTSTSPLQANQINTRGGNGNLNISGSSWRNLNNSYVIHAAGNVNITSPIEYNSSNHSSLNDLPQLVIIADGHIRIAPNVGRVDAWLIAGDKVLTCADGDVTGNYWDGLSATYCNRQLLINGPIQTGSLYLRRTGGAGADGSDAAARSTPAEVINLRSDAYLWAYGRASQGQSIRTDSVKELPPRF